jgi:hypothetical protein
MAMRWGYLKSDSDEARAAASILREIPKSPGAQDDSDSVITI